MRNSHLDSSARISCDEDAAGWQLGNENSMELTQGLPSDCVAALVLKPARLFGLIEVSDSVSTYVR